MSQTEAVVAAGPDADGTAPTSQSVGGRRTSGPLFSVRRALEPVARARGLPRTLILTGAGITLAFILLAVLAPWVARYGFNQYSAHGVRFPRQAAPSAAHWLGTTVQSEDVYARIIYGARTSLEVVVLAVAFSVVIGVPLGLIAGYRGGPLDRVLVLINDSIFAFPYLLLAIVIAFLLQGSVGGGVLTAAIAITAVYIPQYFRVVRSSVLSVREEPYVEAARALGARPATVIRRYVFVNVIQSVPVVASLNAADAILTLAGLSFLGIGMDPSVAAEWGYDVSRGIADAQAGYWWTGMFPGLAIVLMVTGLTLFGEGLNDTINPVLRHTRRRAVTMDRGSGDDRNGVDGRSSVDGAEALLDRAMAGGAVAAQSGSVESRSSAPSTVLRVEDFRVWYAGDSGPVRAVDGVDLSLAAGETVGLVGESGCGKSSLGRGLLGLLPTGAGRAGTARLEDRDLLEIDGAELRDLRGPAIGMIFQEPMTRLDPLMKVSRHFEEALRAHHPAMSDEEVRDRSLRTLGRMGIPPTRFDQYPHEFSGGMRQRIMIALALVLEPRVVVADEPTTALDVLVEAQILAILADLRRDFDLAVLLITHNLAIVAESCDRVAVMYAGRIVEQGPVESVFTRPAHPYTRELLASTISTATIDLHFIPGAPPDLADPPAGCRFHPRCPDVMDICRTQFPPGFQVEGNRRTECWLHDPARRQSP